MRKLVSINDRFGRWTVVNAAPPATYKKQVRWLCRCDCGTERVVAQGELRRANGPSRSCGCLSAELTAARGLRHGLARTPEYRTWVAIKDRTGNPRNKRYRDYGARGIKVCDRWRDSFENFYTDMGRKPAPDHSIERMDVNGDYCPENCKWIPLSEQNRNCQRTPRFTIAGETRTLMEWVELYGADYERVSSRIRKLGWDIVTALTVPKLNGHGKPVAS